MSCHTAYLEYVAAAREFPCFLSLMLCWIKVYVDALDHGNNLYSVCKNLTDLLYCDLNFDWQTYTDRVCSASGAAGKPSIQQRMRPITWKVSISNFKIFWGLLVSLIHCWRLGSDTKGRALEYTLETRCCDHCKKAILINALKPY